MSNGITNRRELGGEGESVAKEYLLQKGYRFLTANFHTRWGEIDLVMEDGGTLVFVEVKKRRNESYGAPEDAVNPHKRRHMMQAALAYLMRAGARDRMARFDVVAINAYGVKHFVNAFPMDGDYY